MTEIHETNGEAFCRSSLLLDLLRTKWVAYSLRNAAKCGNKQCMELKFISFLALAIVAMGCVHTPPQKEKVRESPPAERTRDVKIDTDPSGMRIYFGIAGTEELAREQREYIGLSPCTLTVPCDEQGRFKNKVSSFARPKAVLMAEPPASATNLFPQSQVFSVPATFVRPPPIPAAVFFDMTKPKR